MKTTKTVKDSIKKTSKTSATKKTTKTSTTRRPSVKQVEKKAEKASRQATSPAVEMLYLAQATDAERVAAFKAIQMPVTANVPGGPGGPVGPGPHNPNDPDLIYILQFPVVLLALDLGYHADPRGSYTTEKQKELTKNFTLEEMDPLLVSYRNGIFWVVNGGRRLLAAIDRGMTNLPIHLLCGKSRGYEAEVYAHQERYSILVSPNQKLEARLVAQQRTALYLQAICQQFRLTVCSSCRGVDRPMRAVATATKILDSTFGAATGKYVLCWMFSTMDAVNWFEDRVYLKDAVSSVFLNSFAQVFAEGEAEGKIVVYTKNLHKQLVQLSPQLIHAYGRVEYPLMTRQGSTITILKAIARGALTARDIFKVVNS